MVHKKIFTTAFSFLSATRYHINGGFLLIFTSILALIIANSPLSDIYQSLWNHTVRLQIGSFNLFNHGGHPLTLEEVEEICTKSITSSELEMYRDDGSIYRKRLGLSPDRLQIIKI